METGVETPDHLLFWNLQIKKSKHLKGKNVTVSRVRFASEHSDLAYVYTG